MRNGVRKACHAWFVLLAIYSWAQTPGSSSLIISTRDLPKASLWEPYSFRLQAESGIEPYRWRIAAGSLPQGFTLNPGGQITGTPEDLFHSELSVAATDSSRPPKQVRREFTLATEVPLTAEWSNQAKVNGQRIEGSIKVSNHTGRDFDLTVIVLAVNEIGRATALGYQHFPLQRDTRNLEIPFGDNFSRGNYAVNVDVVGEEGISGRIFRARLVTPNQSITQGP